MERCVGQHYSEPRTETEYIKSPGSLRIRYCFLLSKQDDRARGIGQELFFRRSDLADPAYRIERTAHESKRLLGSVFAPAQSEDGIGVQGIAGQMDAADPLYSEYASVCQKFLRPAECIVPGHTAVGRTGSGIRIKDFRTAVGTAVRLSVIPPVLDITVLVRAVLTHGKLFHYSTLPVIGERFDDRVSGAAVCTVDKRIPVSAVCFCIKFCLAFRTHGNVRGYEGRPCVSPAFQDFESGEVRRARILRNSFRSDSFHRRHGRRRHLKF